MIWKSYADCHDYEVSDEGDVRRVVRCLPRGRKTPYLLGQWRGNTPYNYVNISIDGVSKHVLVHRMVLRTFIGEPPTPHHEGAHRDGSTDNNRLDNLLWATRLENEAHKLGHGTAHVPRKLTAAQVLEMREAYRCDAEISFATIAKRFGVATPTAAGAITGRYWPHLPGATKSKSKGRGRKRNVPPRDADVHN